MADRGADLAMLPPARRNIPPGDARSFRMSVCILPESGGVDEALAATCTYVWVAKMSALSPPPLLPASVRDRQAGSRLRTGHYGWVGKTKEIIELDWYAKAQGIHSVTGDVNKQLKAPCASTQAFAGLLAEIYAIPGANLQRVTRHCPIILSTDLKLTPHARQTNTSLVLRSRSRFNGQCLRPSPGGSPVHPDAPAESPVRGTKLSARLPIPPQFTPQKPFASHFCRAFWSGNMKNVTARRP